MLFPYYIIVHYLASRCTSNILTKNAMASASRTRQWGMFLKNNEAHLASTLTQHIGFFLLKTRFSHSIRPHTRIPNPSLPQSTCPHYCQVLSHLPLLPNINTAAYAAITTTFTTSPITLKSDTDVTIMFNERFNLKNKILISTLINILKPHFFLNQVKNIE